MISTKEYLKSALELEKIIYTLNKTINWLNVQEKKVNTTHQKFTEPVDPRIYKGEDLRGYVLVSVFAGPILGIIIAIISQIVYTIITGKDVNILIIVIVVSIICIILGFLIGCREEKGEIWRYEDKMKKYEELVHNDNLRVEKAVLQKKNIRAQINTLSQKRDVVQQTINKLYSLNVLYPKYRNFVAVSTFYEYFDSGRCNTLAGHEGAYNIFENEIRLEQIKGKLDEVINHLEEIRDGQYVIYNAINEGNRKAEELYHNSMRLLDKTDAIAQNSAISAYSSTISAKNTEILKYIEMFR